MTNQQHPMTPPKDLLQQLRRNADTWLGQITIAYQAGADQELEACVEWLGDAPVVYNDNNDLHPGSYLRDDRRPKPSLKEQALALVEQHEDGWRPSPKDWDTIRKALESLDD